MQSTHPKFISYFLKIFLTITICFSIVSTSNAQEQWKWFNPVKADFKVIQNQGWSDEIGNTYTRFPERAKELLRPAVWNLSQNSAGLGIYFYSNAQEIIIRYHVKDRLNMPHMQSTGVSGIDLYSINSDGIWNFNFGKYAFDDTISYHYQNIPKDKYHQFGYEYRLFLPLYNRVEWMEIGVPDSASFEFIPLLQDKPIVLYGTSIAQGACASRPAMAWTNILQRSMNHPLINLGFSGNGQLEDPVLDLMNEIDARIYILDCYPNLSQKSEDEISQLTINAVKKLRSKSTTPILIIGHSGYSNTETNTVYKSFLEKNDRIPEKIYKTLISEGIKDLYFLSRKELNLSPEAWVDYVHFSDLGMTQQAAAVEKKVREILKEPKGNIITTNQKSVN